MDSSDYKVYISGLDKEQLEDIVRNVDVDAYPERYKLAISRLNDIKDGSVQSVRGGNDGNKQRPEYVSKLIAVMLAVERQINKHPLIVRALFASIFLVYSIIFVNRGWPIQQHPELIYKIAIIIFAWHLVYGYAFNGIMLLMAAADSGYKHPIRILGLVFGLFVLIHSQIKGVNWYG